MLPTLHTPHPLTCSSPFFLSLTSFTSTSLLLFNPFTTTRERGRDQLYNQRGECKRERVTATVWVPRPMMRSREGGREVRERERAGREERRERERRREREKREERERGGVRETDEQRRRRKRREEERRRRDEWEEEQGRREEAEEAEQAAHLLQAQQAEQSSGRMGWDSFLVAHADGCLLCYDKALDAEVAISTPLPAEGAYMRVVAQPVEGMNPTCLFAFGFPHTPPSALTSLAFSTSGSLLCVTQSNGVACVIDYPRRLLRAALASHYGAFLSCAWTADDALLLLGGEDDALTLVDTLTYTVVGRGEGHDAYVNGIYVRPTLEQGVYRIATAGEDGKLLFWEWVTPPRRSRALPPPAPSSEGGVCLRAYPPLHEVRRVQPVASNVVHVGPVASVLGSHGYIARRKEYRRTYKVEVDLMESQAEEGCKVGGGVEGGGIGEGELLVTAGWDWTVKVWGDRGCRRGGRRGRGRGSGCGGE